MNQIPYRHIVAAIVGSQSRADSSAANHAGGKQDCEPTNPDTNPTREASPRGSGLLVCRALARYHCSPASHHPSSALNNDLGPVDSTDRRRYGGCHVRRNQPCSPSLATGTRRDCSPRIGMGYGRVPASRGWFFLHTGGALARCERVERACLQHYGQCSRRRERDTSGPPCGPRAYQRHSAASRTGARYLRAAASSY
jgi:hypothetical protein